MSDCLLVLCNCPGEISAMLIAEALVTERLAACVNRIAGVASTYRWKGEIQHDDEHLLIIKTTRERFDELQKRITALHPYELPEIIALEINAASAAYLAWVGAQTQPDASKG